MLIALLAEFLISTTLIFFYGETLDVQNGTFKFQMSHFLLF